MAKIDSCRKGELIQQLFKILQQNPDGMKAKDALSALADSVTLTDYEKGEYASSKGRRFGYLVRFTTIVYVKAEWMTKHKGIWNVTDLGLIALQEYPNPNMFHQEARKLYKQWKQENKKLSSEISLDLDDSSTIDDEDDNSVTFEQAEEQAREAIEKHITTGLPPYEFQDLIADLLKAMGYFVSWVAPPGKDAGVDIIAYSDPLGTTGPRIKVQVKRQQAKIGIADLKSFMANIGQLDSGIFVCTGGFSKDATDFARGQETKRIMLINLEQLIELWIQFTPKLNDRARQRLPLTPIYFLTPVD